MPCSRLYRHQAFSRGEGEHLTRPLIELGDPLLFKLLEWFIVKELPPHYELVLHPVAYAAWVGLFVTSLNLLPIGQLDGGHIVYAVFGEKSRFVYKALIPILLVLAVFYSAGWIVLTILLIVFGIHHPRPLDNWTPLDKKRRYLALFMLLVFVVSFVPAPFPGEALESSSASCSRVRAGITPKP